MAIRVLLAEDHILVRKGLCSLLAAETGIEVVGEAGNGIEAVEKAQELDPDVVVMDLGMPTLNGIEATRRIRETCPRARVLALTMHGTREYIRQMLCAGASGYLVKQAAPEELVSAVQVVGRGESYLSPVVSGALIQEYLGLARDRGGMDPYERLTNREREVLQLIAKGHTTRPIAEQLQISVKTVETHRTHLARKLGLHSTADLTRYAIRKGVVALDG